MNICAHIIGMVLLVAPTLTSAQSAGDTTECVIFGSITGRSENKWSVAYEPADILPARNVKGEMLIPIEHALSGGSVRGWIAIGDMQVSEIQNKTISFTLLQDFGTPGESGNKNSPLPGTPVKFVWLVPVSPDELSFQQGENAFDSDPAKALLYYRQAVMINPLHDKALNMAGVLLAELHMADSALPYLMRAFAIDSTNGRYIKNICMTSNQAGMNEQAFAFAEKAVRNDGSDAEARYLRALTRYLVHEDDAGTDDISAILADIDRAVMLDPEEAFFRAERAYFRYAFGDTAGACDDARHARDMGGEVDEMIMEYCN
jgi:hypothetical protein